MHISPRPATDVKAEHQSVAERNSGLPFPLLSGRLMANVPLLVQLHRSMDHVPPALLRSLAVDLREFAAEARALEARAAR